MPLPPRQRPLLEDIERRILYSADTPTGALAATLPRTEAQTEQAQAAAPAQAQAAVELVVLDERVPDADALLQDIAAQAAEGRSIEVVRVGADEDGVAAITAALAGRSDVAALHIVSHGGSGAVQLGQQALDNDTLLARAADIAGWGSHLASGADILLYGCDVASDDAGRALVQGLADLTGADVAASTDATGAAALGGNWLLEMQTGHIEARLAFDMQTQAQWQGLLATYTVTSTADSGAGTLRQAITDANANAGADTIVFNIAGAGLQTINLTSALPTITGALTINGYTQSDAAVNSASTGSNAVIRIALNGSGAGAGVNGLNFGAGSEGSSVRGLAIGGFTGAGILTSVGGLTVAGNFIGTNAAGTAANANATGISVAGSGATTIGSATLADRNLVSGNTNNIVSSGTGALTIQGNLVGTNNGGSTTIGTPTAGISISAGTANAVGGANAGEGNVIAGGARGVVVTNTGTVASIVGNTISQTTTLGIDLGNDGSTANDAGDADTGANALQNFPVITGAQTSADGYVAVQGTLNSTAGGSYRIDFYASPSGTTIREGRVYLGTITVTTNASGNVSFKATLSGSTVATGALISATATRLNGTALAETSEFSAYQATTAMNVVTVTTTAYSGAGSLAAAINAANAASGPTLIRFAIAGTGLHTITLPTLDPDNPIVLRITKQVILDATTDDSFAANGNQPAIQIDGNGNESAFTLSSGASGSTVRGFAITNFSYSGIYTEVNSNNNVIAGNYIGTIGAGGQTLSTSILYGIWIDTGNNNRVGGSSAADRNVIAGITGTAIAVTADGADATGNVVQGNYVGVMPDGLSAVSSPGQGIQVATAAGFAITNTLVQGNWVARTAFSAISVNGNATGSTVQGNRIGTDAAGTANWGTLSSAGIFLSGGAANNLFQNNVVAFSGANGGILMAASTGAGNAVLANQIYSNAGPGIDLGFDGVTANDTGDADTGANSLQNFPVLTLARTDGAGSFTVSGTINSTANTYLRIELFSNPANDSTGYGEGQTYLGFVNVLTDGSGNASFSTTLSATVAAGAFISATATRSNSSYITFTDTSEFARNVVAISTTQNTLVVDTASDTVDGDTTSLSTLLATKGTDGFISLREALLAINNTPAGSLPTLVNFNIAGNGVHTITLGSLLPYITRPVIIDGTTDTGSVAANGGRPAIVINVNGIAGDGLRLDTGSGGSTIRGLVINNYTSNNSASAIRITAGSSGNTIAGNYLGAVGADGEKAAVSSGDDAIWIQSSNNTIGGATVADRNVIGLDGTASGFYAILIESGNGNQILGNYTGVNATGTTGFTGLQSGIWINSASAANTRIENNLISAAGDVGIAVNTGGAGTQVLNNRIGINAAGTALLATTTPTGIIVYATGTGLVISGNWVGGTTTAAISVQADGVTVQGNRIGTDLAGTANWGGRQSGIRITGSNNLVGGTSPGQGNLIAFSNQQGTTADAISVSSGTGNAILGNSIYGTSLSASALGIDLGTSGVTANDTGDADTGANNLQNFPVLTVARTNGSGSFEIAGSINSTANTYIRIELFSNTTLSANGYGEGQTYLGFVNVLTDGAGNASFSTTLSATVAAGAFISATATRSVAGYGSFSDTSEFARSIVAISTVQNTLVVTTAADTVDGDTTSLSTLLATKGADGFISLREALLAINGTPAGSLPTLVNFGITGTGVHTITLGSELPAITRPVVINGTTDDSFAANSSRPAIVLQGNGSGSSWSGLSLGSGSSGSTVRGLVIRGFDKAIYLQAGSSGNTIVGNYLGPLQADGSYTSAASAQTTWGVLVEGANNTIGGTAAADRNVIAGALGSGANIGLQLATATGNRILGNYLGTNASGTPLGLGGEGVYIRASAANNQVGGTAAGEGNLIAGSGVPGVSVSTGAGTGNAILSNSIYANGGLGINLDAAGVTANDTGDADTGPNNLQNYPVLTLARTNGSGSFEITGTINSTANTYIRVELFASTANDATGYGEGQTYLGFVNVLTNGSGNASFSTTISATVAAGAFISATATRSVAGYGSFSDTSEFAKSIVAVSSTQAVLIVDTAADTLDGDTTSISTLLASKGADGFISLREALLAINNTPAGSLPTLVNFGIAGTGVHTITLGSALPTISRPVVINGTTDDSFAANVNRPAIVLQGNGSGSTWFGLEFQSGSGGSTVRGLVIRGFNAAIYLRAGSDGNTIVGNYIGALQADGTYTSATSAETTWGVEVESANNTIGGTTAADRNVISGMLNAGAGVSLETTGATGNRVIGNYMGTNASGTPLGVGAEGVITRAGAFNNMIGGTAAGEGNLIAGAALRGIWITPDSGAGNAILGNSIYSNASLGIDLGNAGVTANDTGDADTGPNNLQNFPVLTLARTNGAGSFEISGTINSTANTYLRIELFANTANDPTGYGEGQTYLGFVNVLTDGSGNASFSTTLSVTVAAGAFISATATKSVAGYGSFSDTSEFARSVVAIHTTQQNVLIVTTASDTVDGDTTSLSTLLATKGADGFISLREALLALNNTPANGLPTLLNFGIAGTGVHTITLGSVLPAISKPVVINASSDDSFAANGNRPAIVLQGGGYTSGWVGLDFYDGSDGSTVRGLVIQGFEVGIYLRAGADGNTIAGNYIGPLQADGSYTSAAAAQSTWGVIVESANNTIGGTTAADRNVVAGLRTAGAGIYLLGTTATGNRIIGNTLGSNASGTPLGVGGEAVILTNGAHDNRIGGTAAGEGNLIAGSELRGVWLAPAAGSGNAILSNTIHSNGGLGIDLGDQGVTANDAGDADTGPNNLQNFPVLASVGLASNQFTVTGTLNSEANKTYRIEFYGMPYGSTDGSGNGEGNVFLGFIEVTTDASGNASIGATLAAAGLSYGAWITATATEKTGASSYGSTSEFAANVQAANTAPVITVPTSASYTENAAPVTLAPGATVVDTELAAAGNYAGATLTLQRNGGANAQDLFAATGGSLSALTEGGSLVYGGTTVGTVTTNSGGRLVLSFNANATQALVDNVLRAIGYANSSDAPPASVALTWSFSDGNTGPQGGGGALVGSGSTTVSITAVNDAPVVTTTGSTLSYTENAAATAVDPGVAVSDADNTNLTGATVTISGNYVNGQDVLAFVNANGITGSWNAATGVLTLTGSATVADYQAALRSITYVNTSDNPSTATRTVSFVVNDGTASSAAATRDIAVTAVNDAPVITSNGGGATAAVSVAENSTAVTTVTATDPDRTTPTYAIAGGADAALFSIDSTTGALRFIGAPDHENPLDANGDNVYEVIVRATDGVLSDDQALSVTVTNVNEAGVGAVTDADAAANRVAENAANGTVVGVTAFADDPDTPDTVSYSLTDNAGGRFAIDATTGVVTVANGSLLDYEAAASHQITVLATSSDGSTSSANFTISLTDVNEAPVGAVTDVDPATNSVAENAANSTVVGITAQAIDPDGTATVTYSLSNSAGGRFTINASTGVVTVANGSLLDYESAASHQITVLATSSDGSTSSANFTVNLTDVNEAPVGAVTDVDAAANTVPENAVNGVAVGITAQALDPDGTATVTYSLSNSAGGRFSIDANTGVVTVANGSLLDYETAASHQITVLATSSDGSTSSANFTISLTDVNEAPVGAVTDANPAANTVPENAANGTAAGITAQAIDPDGTATVTYSLSNSAGGRFTIDASTGVVTVANSSLLDYESATSHQITVLATSSDGSTASANFTINLTDVNEAPVGAVTDVDPAANTVAENVADGTVVGITAQAIDPDGTATVSYSLSNSAGGRFTINANTGVVTVANSSLLDYESATSHQITVLATSSDGSTSSADFTISLTDVNEAPVGAVNDVDPAANTVPENAANGTVVGITAQAIDPDGTATVTYSLSNSAGGRFTIDANTGVVTVANSSLLDYESATSHQITVLATSSDGSTSSANFTISLTDVNEAPVGALTDVDAAANQVPENAANGTVVGITAQAVDPDGTATVSYSLSNSAGGRFTIDASTGVVTVANGSLLDYETANSHQITVLATSSDGSTSSANFTINLTDVNEAPVGAVTDVDAAANTVPENAANGTTVGITAQAIDPDGTATVTYSLSNSAGGRFTIDASTGVVTVANSSLLDYESATSHQITVLATSSDGSTSSANFTISLTDVNEAPVGAVNDVDPATNAVAENAANGTPVGITAQAIDPDGTATVTYSLSNSAGGRFSIDASTGVVTVANGSLLDYETADSHQITVLATSSDGSTSSANFTINLTDVNEAPVGAVADVDPAANTVPENAANGAVVGITAQAIDPDGTATVSYSLSNSAGGRFTIDATTGVVTVANGSLLDYENATSHQITVLATSSDGSTSSANFTIGLTDVNEAPVGAVTDVDAAANTVPENAANGTVVGITARAIDPDGTATVGYSLTDNAGGRFTIDASTGVVTVANSSLLDYETATSHQITVRATSSDGSTSTANFTISLTDVNEAPVGAVTDVDAAANTVPENAANGTVVGVTAQAIDPDGTATVTYSLTNNAGGRFAIDATTGVVTVANGSLLDYETASSHQITVLATSSDGSSSSANFTIGLTDVNEAPVGAVTDVDAAANTVPENAANGTAVGITAQALDPDGTATVSYSLTDNAGGRFAIDATTGVVTVANGSLLDYETASSHQITVLATSSDGSTSSANFTIGLTDVNEAPVGAVSDVDPAANAVPENAATGTVVGITAQATDPDGTATVTYSLSNSAGGRFTINASTGIVTVANGSLLDYETASSHQITVLATSSDGSTSSANFTINLTDVNEAPVGAVTDVNPAGNTVAENAANGTVVGITAQAIDPDGTATVSYSLSNNAGGRFTIDANTGVVTVANGSLLDYETASSHQITVLATSSDGSTSSANFTISLTDMNEAPVGAVTDVDPAANAVPENATNGTAVGITAQAIDPDGTASVTYSLSNSAGGRFTIDASTGVVTVADGSLLDYEVAASHQITVLATSSDGSTSSANFTINLTDVNEAPVGAVADVDPAANTVPENAANGTVVGITAQAIDPDGTATVSYSLSNSAGGRFTIDATTGVVTVANGSLLDYESATSHQITVLATSSDGSTSSANFTINLTDVNEAPVSAVTDVDAAANTVPENAANGTAVGITAQALDPDGTATVTYSLTDNAGGRFTINASTGIVTVANGSLLDYETSSSHQITVLATSSDGSTSSANFTIAVGDVNEAPVGAVTDVDAAANEVPENAVNGTVVGITAQAIDPDGTATVTYSLSNSAGGRFSIDANTGVVTVANSSLLDYESATSHQITVLATSSDGSTSSANFTISLTDVNEAPVGAVTDVDAAANQVPENAANGTVVGITAQAIDPDGTATVTYSLSNSAGGRFTIDANTGVVTVANGSLLDYEAASSHQITVLATSSDGSTSSANFTINLTDVNEAPVGAVNDVDAAANTVPENAANGTVVGITAQAVDPDGSATVSYSLTDNAGGRFTINASTGVVTVANGSLLDYETASSHQITVLATSSDGSTSSANFTINLTDVNEAPVGAVTDVDAAANTVAENAANGTVVGITAQAIDPDGTATVTYSLSNNAGGRFTIDASTGVVTVANGSLLDYETASSHQITVRATSSDGSTSSANFTINLTDVNEAPLGAVTDVDPAANTVPENAANGSTVGITAQATDPDGTASVSYSLTDNAGGRFSIDANTGVVTVADGSLLDYETAPSHQITVQATSSDGSTSSMSFTVQLGDVNEAPVGAVTDVDAAANTVAENAANGTAVGITAQAVDPDGTATVTYSLTNNAGGRFAIDATTGVVTVANGSLLDYETASSHQITVRATSSDGSTSSANFTINLTDLNEAPVGPVVDVNPAANQVPENAATGTPVGITAQAVDPDGTATVSYTLSNDAGGRFTIDPATGVVTVADGSLLDYEGQSQYQITVLATSSDGSTSSLNFTIHLTDVNEAPVGAVSDVDPAANTVPENAATGTPVGITAQAIDPDGTATVTYSLGNNAGGRFAIDAVTGVVTVADGSLLDYESATSHQITVLATSSDGSTSSASFTIALSDVNEAVISPVVDTDPAANRVPENAATGTPVGITAFARDPDAGATVSYTLVDNAGGRFAIDATTGVVTVADGSLLDYEAATTHGIVVRATSSDGSTTDTAFSITLGDVNEFAVGPAVDTDPAPNRVDDNAATGATVGITAHAVDADGSNNTVHYSLSDDAGGRFTIDAQTGVVTVADGTRLHDADGFTIKVLATSSDGSSSETVFSVAVRNTDVQAPVVTSPASVAVPENSTDVLQVTASDADSPASALIYSIVGGADAARFTIDARTGVLRFATAPDYEIPADADGDNLYDVRVRVSDGRQSSEQQLAVQVTPVNDNAPRFTTPAGVVEVPENSTEVVRVQAVDADLPAETLRYSIVGGADAARFTIDPQTGMLRFVQAPDREAPGDADGDNDYAVVVGVSDGLHNASLALTVRVRDVLDGGGLPGGTVQVSVPEQQTAVTTVPATGTDGQALQYRLAGGSDAALFTIDAATGRLAFRAPPLFLAPRDADGDNVYEVLVRVSDGERTGDYRVLVTVTGNPVVQPNPVPAAPVPGPTPPVAVPVLPSLPGAGTGPGLGSDPAAGGTDTAQEGGPQFAGGAEAVHAEHVPGTRPAPAVLLAPATQQALPADLLLRVQWRQSDYHASWGDIDLPELLLPELLRSQPGDASAQTGRRPWPDALPVVADTTEEARGDGLQASAALDQALAGGIAIGLGAAFWASRGSALLASLLAMSPAWTSMDPLPVLNRRQRGPRDPRAQQPFGDAKDDNAGGTEPEDARRKDDEAVAEDKQ